MAFPIIGVDRLGEGAEFREGVRFAIAGDFILDLGQKSFVVISLYFIWCENTQYCFIYIEARGVCMCM